MVFLCKKTLSRFIPIIKPIATHIILEGKDNPTSCLTLVAYHSYNPRIFSGSESMHDTYRDINKAIHTIAYFPMVR